MCIDNNFEGITLGLDDDFEGITPEFDNNSEGITPECMKALNPVCNFEDAVTARITVPTSMPGSISAIVLYTSPVLRYRVSILSIV